MIKRVAEFALNQPFFLLLLVALFVAGGVAAFRSLPVEAFPDVTDTQVQVITLFPGRAAEEVEKQVTIPVEIGAQRDPAFRTPVFAYAVRFVVHRRNFRRRGRRLLCPSAGPRAAARGRSPPGSRPISGRGDADRRDLPIPPAGATRRPTSCAPSRTGRSSGSSEVPGVADVVTCGGFIKQYQVEPDLARINYGVTLQQLFTALGAAMPTPAAAMSSRASSST